VKLLALSPQVGAPFLPPDYEAVALADYPLSRVCYINLNKAPDKKLPPALEEFARFILSREGQRIVLEQAVFLPLRESQAAASRTALK